MERKLEDSKNGTDTTNEVTSIEAGDILGEVQYAHEEASLPSQQLHRNFSGRHIQMIGLAGSIGSGLFLGTGKVSQIYSRTHIHSLSRDWRR